MARVTNAVTLDNGRCGQNLQLGNDPNASHVAKPTFILNGDGGASEYDVSIDGQSIGTFKSDGWANVCILAPNPLSEGQHTLTATEIKPRPENPVSPYKFSVDTTPPSVPTTPILSTWSDTLPPAGDNVTSFRRLNFTGKCDPNSQMFLFAGPTMVGGARSDANGNYSATTTDLSDGTFSIFAVGQDQAGNRSGPSAATVVTVRTTTTVKVPGAPTVTGTNTSTVVAWTPPASDGGAPVTGYRVYRYVGGVQTLLGTTGNTTFTDQNPPSGATYKVSAINSQGEGPLSA